MAERELIEEVVVHLVVLAVISVWFISTIDVEDVEFSRMGLRRWDEARQSIIIRLVSEGRRSVLIGEQVLFFLPLADAGRCEDAVDIHQLILQEGHIPTGQESFPGSLASGIVQPPGLRLAGVAKEYTREAASIEFACPLSGVIDVHIRQAAEYSKALDRRFGAGPGLVRRLVGDCTSWAAIPHVHSVVRCLCPESRWQASSVEHAAHRTEDDAIHPFSHAVVLRCVRWCDLTLYPFFAKVASERTRDVFPPSISAKGHDVLTCGFLRPGFVGLEVTEHFIAGFHGEDHNVAAVVVNEGQ